MDMALRSRWRIDDEVRVIRNVRDDGTYPGAAMGDLLVRRGSIGVVRDVGTFLQDQVIYSVWFYAGNCVVGCREEELIGIDETWTPSCFEFRDKVKSCGILKVDGVARVQPGDAGEIIRVVRDHPGCPAAYHVHFETLPGRVLLVPENMLESGAPVSSIAGEPA
ncbi:MAG: nitrogen fixation protein NifZ [Zoogloeaceae bacterium]|jgi:nitrogen fixation protein NifZ|nr:nitrogen fixation protein NifZ [Zoogloeaceae bacterium]